MFILRVDMHSHGIHNYCEKILKERMHFASVVDSKVVGRNRNLRPFCAHMTSYFFFFLAQARSVIDS